jgi:hypothetical protein
MRMALLVRRLAAVALLSLVPAFASASELDLSPHRRFRPAEPRLQELLALGMQISPTFRALVGRVARSDVIVYVVSDETTPRGIDGQLTFLSAAGGVRYVVVRLRPLASRLDEVALLAHELQHAVEIADTPAIVDASSMQQEYSRIGRAGRPVREAITFDTRAAVETGIQVAREVRGIVVDAATMASRQARAGTR